MSNLSIGNVQDMVNDFLSGLYNFTKDGKCSECGSCCSRYLAVNYHAPKGTWLVKATS